MSMPEKRQEHPFEKIEYNKLYQFEEIVGKKIKLEKKSDFNPYRKPEYFFNELSDDEKN